MQIRIVSLFELFGSTICTVRLWGFIYRERRANLKLPKMQKFTIGAKSKKRFL